MWICVYGWSVLSYLAVPYNNGFVEDTHRLATTRFWLKNKSPSA